MLEPDTRYLLLDSLRPPPGYKLDMAVGTTFTLNLETLMTVPTAFAMFDRQREDGSLAHDQVAILQALRENAGRITLFSQAGMTGVPAEFRSLYVLLEDSIYPVLPPDAEAIFHPKVWYLRYRGAVEGDVVYRLLCLSRNLTFDRSWDTVLRLDGKPGDVGQAPELERFARSLVAMSEATRPLPPERSEAIIELGRGFSQVEWQAPEGFDEVRFWPLGDDGARRSPFPDSFHRILMISPFLTRWPIDRLTRNQAIEESIVLSRPESFELLGGDATKHLTERLVLSPDASTPELADADADSPAEESVAESLHSALHGLHAKLYVMDQAGGRSRVLTGSTNATWPAFHGNVEFLVELVGPTEHAGVRATIGDKQDRLGLRSLVEPFEPPNDDPVGPSEEEQIQLGLGRASRLLGGLHYTADCIEESEDVWKVALQGEAIRNQELDLERFTLEIRPLTLRKQPVKPTVDGGQLAATFNLSREAVTPYFAFSLTLRSTTAEFLVTAELLNSPPDRETRVLRDVLNNPRDFVRLLLLLLGQTDDALAMGGSGCGNGPNGAWLTGFSDALLEPMVRAFARNPERLREIEQLIRDLDIRDDKESALPKGWWDIWTPISKALESDGRE